MNLILLEPEDFVAGGRARVVGRRLAHVRDVHRARPGQELSVGVLGGKIGRGRVARLDDEALELEVTLERDPPPKLAMTLVVALPRPKVVNRVVAAAASLGVARLFLVNAWRVEKAYWGNHRLAPASLREQLVLGLEQAKDTVLPELHLRRLFVPFVEEELPGLVAGATALVAHPGAVEPAPRAVDGPVVVALGPEGGFIAAELDSLVRAGLRPVTLGPRVLRTETALAALVGRLGRS
jgi:RsmE family RNA methyltransferase